MKDLWVEKYRPKTVNDYVFHNDNLKQKMKEWISEQSIPNILFYGNPGCGKTAAAKIIIREIGVRDLDLKIANGSKELRKIDWIDKLIAWCSTMPFGDYKVVFIDEFDHANKNSVQPALRFLIEQYASKVRFICTANYPHRIIPPLHSRFQSFHIEKFNEVDFLERMATILINENIYFELFILEDHVKRWYPDMRKCINELESSSIGGELLPPVNVISSNDYLIDMVELFKQGKISEARRLVCSQVTADQVEDVYEWLYSNLDLLGDTDKKQDDAILIIKQGLVDLPSCGDPEICLAGTMVRLGRNYIS